MRRLLPLLFLLLVVPALGNTPQKTLTYTRGLDLSGSLGGAGGIGGLLAMTSRATNTWQHYYYDLDGSGNVVGLIDTNEAVVASYRYDPLGNPLWATGPQAALNRLRAWGKEWHPQSGLMHFGFREYYPSLHRWTTEDPLGEAGGINLFRFVGNDPVNLIDPYGLEVFSYPSGQGPRWGLIGPAPYVYGETRFERYVQAPLMNTVSTAVNLPAAAVGFVDWASEQSGLTRLMGISPSDAMVAVAPMFPAASASSRCAATTTANLTKLAEQDVVVGMMKEGQVLKQVPYPSNPMLAPTHEAIAKELGVWAGKGELAPGVEAFTVWKEGGKVKVRGSGNFTPTVSAETETALRKLFE